MSSLVGQFFSTNEDIDMTLEEAIERKKQDIIDLMNQMQSPKSVCYLFDVAEIMLDIENEAKSELQ